MRLLSGFLAGVLFSAAIFGGPVVAAHVEVRCKPIVLPKCDNALKMFFENKGTVPNRCRTT